MAERTFEIRTEPHVAHVGGIDLLFEPEVIGSEFVAAYTKFQAVEARVSAPRKGLNDAQKLAADLEAVNDVEAAMREMLAQFIMPVSRPAFDELRLPQRLLVGMIEWTAELYGGGSGNPDDATGPSSD